MDFVNVLDMGSDGIAHVVELAAKIKADPSSVAGTRSGLRVGLFFEKPSTRTRVSCEVGTAELGAQPIVLKNDEVGLGTREAPQDVARVLERYLVRTSKMARTAFQKRLESERKEHKDGGKLE